MGAAACSCRGEALHEGATRWRAQRPHRRRPRRSGPLAPETVDPPRDLDADPARKRTGSPLTRSGARTLPYPPPPPGRADASVPRSRASAARAAPAVRPATRWRDGGPGSTRPRSGHQAPDRPRKNWPCVVTAFPTYGFPHPSPIGDRVPRGGSRGPPVPPRHRQRPQPGAPEPKARNSATGPRRTPTPGRDSAIFPTSKGVSQRHRQVGI